MSRSVFYCRCGERLEGAAARFAHRCKPGAVRPIGPRGCGLYVDGEGTLHFDVPEFLRHAGWEDTPVNRDKATELIAEVARSQLPGVPVIEQ